MRKQAIIHQPYDVRIDEIPALEQRLGDFELHVRTELSALSPGTETRIYAGLQAERFSYRVSYPFAVGYNNVGRVVAVGSRVTKYQPGQRVFTRMPHLSEYVVAEKAAPGSDAANPNVPASYHVIAPVPENVPTEEAVLTHLLTLGFNALHRGQYRFGENVLVIGLGLVGLGAVSMARAAGARVAAIGNDEFRLHMARTVGADEGWLSGDDDAGRASRFAGEAGLDLILVCADAWSALRTAIHLSRRNTRIVVLAFPGAGQEPAPFDPFEPADFYNRSLSYIASSWMPTDEYPPEYQRFTVPRMYGYILDLMAGRRIDVSPLLTHRFPIGRIRDAFELALSKDKSVIGVVFDWN
ncbi:MAG: zinc-binding alcohol dehydrogenase [Acidobacteriota bacterium]